MDVATLPAWSALLVALVAGAASFLSPCVAPLLPGYIAFVAGNAGQERDSGTFSRAVGFVAGFTILFALLGASAAAFSRQLTNNRPELELVSGLLVALFGLAMLFDRALMPARLAASAQQSTSRHASPRNALTAMPIGAAFAVAWSPCIGPALAAILALAAGDARPAWGATLLIAYGLGLGIPFLLGAIAIERVHGISRALRRHAKAIRITGGLLLLVLGTAIATGRFGEVTARLARIAPDWLV
ncbi:MAG: cytochrome c biosis protein [Thermoleophilia bacterium]|nr:cytochrome c biosis protein [Thermoleophilia bacterium]MCZ4496091.1 cytochrome c biosis protein [Thermoleophilia bacterium]